MSKNDGGFMPFSTAESDPVSRLTDSAVSLRPPAGAAPISDTMMVPMEARASIRVLVVDDDRILREGCASVLQVEGYNVVSSGRGHEAIELFKRSRFDIVLVDLYMTPVPGVEILKAVLEVQPNTIVIVMTGNPSVASSLEAMRIGAWDYLPKPFSGTHLHLMFGRAAHAVLTNRARTESNTELAAQHGNSDQISLLGISPAFRSAVDLARKVAATNASVMLVGESGTGKEMFAQFIHRHSRRSGEALIPINCAAMPEHLLESEMFGHRKGAFTGADREKTGLLEAAHGGTFFLDELTEMALPLQAKLLRVVQDGVVRRVGSEQQDAQVDIRFISATNRDPRLAIQSKHLREDLYYRLNVVSVALPPLRSRVEDIPILANHFLGHFWKRHHTDRDAMPKFNESALEFLQGRAWRGNVRELQNVIEHLVVLASPGTVIQPEDIPLHKQDDSFSDPVATVGIPMHDAYHVAKDQVLASFEKEYVTRLVARASGNMSRAARLASVDRTTLYRLLERHGFRKDSNESLTL
ncbi:MAG: sigma-54 dependent transcriptional regulator [bacterium]